MNVVLSGAVIMSMVLQPYEYESVKDHACSMYMFHSNRAAIEERRIFGKWYDEKMAHAYDVSCKALTYDVENNALGTIFISQIDQSVQDLRVYSKWWMDVGDDEYMKNYEEIFEEIEDVKKMMDYILSVSGIQT
jgi:hypothetical protein